MSDLIVRAEEEVWLALKYSVLERNLETVFGKFRESRIEPVLIKGWAASLVYPVRPERYSSDIDLAVAPSAYEESLKIAGRIKNINIDVHRGLRHLDTVEWETLFENSRQIPLGDTKIRVLSEEDHLRVLAVHWLQDGGAYRHKLRDIYFSVANRTESFDWDKCLNVVSEKRKKWIINTIGLAHKYLGLEIRELDFYVEALNIPQWVLKTVEREWKSDVKLIPLRNSLSDKKQFLKQILKRIPPNAIQATIEMEGEFDNFPRIYYQTGSFIKRLQNSTMSLITIKQKG